MSDIYGTDIAQGVNQDLQVTAQGDLATVTGIANLQKALQRRWGTRVGALFYSPSYGNPLWDLLSGPINSEWIDQATIAARNCLLGDARVADVQVTITPSPINRTVFFLCEWTAVDGATGQIQQAVTPGV